jgi:hypothetical protein
VTSATSGMPAGSQGVFLTAATQPGLVVVSFWDGGPLKVSLDTVELVERPEPWDWINDPRD